MAGESLRVISGKAIGLQIALDTELLIGRATTDEGRLGGDPSFPRRHARVLRRAGDQCLIEDLGSRNGTFLNGRRVDEPQVLTPGDTIKVGTTTLQVLDASGNAPEATALGSVLRRKQGTPATALGGGTPAPPPRQP